MSVGKEFRDEFALRVKLAREEAGYTQEELAMLLNITQPTYSKYEGTRRGDSEGSTLMPHDMLLKFCLICHVSIEWLLAGSSGASRPIRRLRKKKGSAA